MEENITEEDHLNFLNALYEFSELSLEEFQILMEEIVEMGHNIYDDDKSGKDISNINYREECVNRFKNRINELNDGNNNRRK